jgi:transcriptional regulator with XRE-family HTH domain
MINPGDELRKLLKKKRMKQAEFARLMGVSEPLVSMILSGAREPSWEILEYLGLKREVRVIYRKVNGS